jgi:hypothetical protein
VDTDRDRDIALLEVQEENRKLVEEYYREKLGKRGMQNANQNSEGQPGGGAEGGAAGGAAGPATGEILP